MLVPVINTKWIPDAGNWEGQLRWQGEGSNHQASSFPPKNYAVRFILSWFNFPSLDFWWFGNEWRLYITMRFFTSQAVLTSTCQRGYRLGTTTATWPYKCQPCLNDKVTEELFQAGRCSKCTSLGFCRWKPPLLRSLGERCLKISFRGVGGLSTAVTTWWKVVCIMSPRGNTLPGNSLAWAEMSQSYWDMSPKRGTALNYQWFFPEKN